MATFPLDHPIQKEVMKAMAKNVRGRHDDAGNQVGGFQGSDPDLGLGEQENADAVARENGGGEGAAAPSGQERAGNSTARENVSFLSSGTETATKGRTEAEKAAAFSRLASIRASNAADAMRGLGHLANAKQYAFTREQVAGMLNALQGSIDALTKAFEVALVDMQAPASAAGETGRRKRRSRVNFSVRV